MKRIIKKIEGVVVVPEGSVVYNLANPEDIPCYVIDCITDSEDSFGNLYEAIMDDAGNVTETIQLEGYEMKHSFAGWDNYLAVDNNNITLEGI